MPDSGHFADFFAADDELIVATAEFLAEGFASGCSCIAVLTEKHFDAVRQSLAVRNLDLQRLIDDYRFVALDATQTLESLWVDDRLDMCAYYRKFGDLIRLMTAGDKQVRIVGEIVDLLAQRGRLDVVMQIEELCNDLSREHSFRMYCLYCENAFVKPLDDGARRRVCAMHSGSLRTA
jgi:KaiC/GvpD/RAD55 family RecA-like ATPase